VVTGEPVILATDDLAICHDGAMLVIHDGPGTIRHDGPIAHLVGAAAERERIAGLLARVAAQEAEAT
jgi:hypothetical protein